ncbi:ABC transporter substrate-binding protein [Pseudoalteromonas sp. YIC-656]|uniref:ABC transporter substrate-binding protein n=1 Tax=Pseudoalteromonas pernae TaxID=3118054 RepID=UPI0032428FB8
MNWCKSLLLTLGLAFAPLICAKTSVLLINPSHSDDPFWRKVETFTAYAAQDLEMKFDVIYGDAHREFQQQNLQEYLAKNPAPDYAILINYPGGDGQSMKLLEAHKVFYITLEQTLSEKEREAIGLPGEKLKYWLSELSHDNEQAGSDLTQELIRQAKAKNMNHVSLVAIGGHYGAETDHRVRGMEHFLSLEKVPLSQLVHAQWRADLAAKQTTLLLRRYPETNIIWSASDEMAMAASDAAILAGKHVNNDIFIGGFDWLPAALNRIEKQQLTASVGGHFLMGAWAVIKAYDHDKLGEKARLPANISFKLAIANADNVLRIKPLVEPLNWRDIDFKQYTRTHNSSLTDYPFDVSSILEQHFTSQ